MSVINNIDNDKFEIIIRKINDFKIIKAFKYIDILRIEIDEHISNLFDHLKEIKVNILDLSKYKHLIQNDLEDKHKYIEDNVNLIIFNTFGNNDDEKIIPYHTLILFINTRTMFINVNFDNQTDLDLNLNKSKIIHKSNMCFKYLEDNDLHQGLHVRYMFKPYEISKGEYSYESSIEWINTITNITPFVKSINRICVQIYNNENNVNKAKLITSNENEKNNINMINQIKRDKQNYDKIIESFIEHILNYEKIFNVNN